MRIIYIGSDIRRAVWDKDWPELVRAVNPDGTVLINGSNAVFSVIYADEIAANSSRNVDIITQVSLDRRDVQNRTKYYIDNLSVPARVMERDGWTPRRPPIPGG